MAWMEAEQASAALGISMRRLRKRAQKGRIATRPHPEHAQRKLYEVLGQQAPAAPPEPDPLERETQRRQESRLRSEHARLLEMLRVERERSAFLAKLHEAPHTPRIERKERRSGRREMTAVAIASDWHVEESIPALKAGYRNEYNIDIADASVRRFFRGFIDLVQHHRASGHAVINTAVIGLLGDLMTGYIHEELIETNALSPVETAIWLMPRLKEGLLSVVDELDLRQLLVPVVPGNHGRTTTKLRIATGPENSYEWMIGRMLERELAGDSRIAFDTSPTVHQYAEAFGFTLHFHHGDSLKYAGGVGGLAVPLLRAVPAWDDVRYAHYHHVGHWHQLRDFGRVLVNGSLIGYGPYSQWIRAPFEPPQQLFYLLDSRRGRCMTTPIWVREDPTEDAAGQRAAAGGRIHGQG